MSINLLYCGDKKTIDGLIISLLSIIKHEKNQLNIYILTMSYQEYEAISKKEIKILETIIKNVNKKSSITLIDVKSFFYKYLPIKNLNTRFTIYSFLRLYIDLIFNDLDKILYLDYDVVCNQNFLKFYNMDITNYEIAGALDYYGSHIFRKKIKRDYINSGVILFNITKIKETKLLEKCRKLCQTKKMLLPDQTSLNKYAKKKIVPSIFNEQHNMKKDTVFRHFTTAFKLFPKIKTQKIKPWNIFALHHTLNTYCFDDILEEYQKIKEIINNE